jgi:iron complex outermembrane receptor protein
MTMSLDAHEQIRRGIRSGHSRCSGVTLIAVLASSLLTLNVQAEDDAGGDDRDGGAGSETAPGPSPAPAQITESEPAGAATVPVVESPAPIEGDTPELENGLGDLDLAALLDKVVVTATKSAMREDQAPAITTVISREEIQQWGYQSVEEVLHHVAGLYVVDDHIIPNLAVRGISGGLRSESGLVKVMIDGRTVAFRSTAGNWLGPELVPLSVVKQIEIIRGPASSLYGADAFLGVINVVTRRAQEIQGAEVAMIGAQEGRSTWGYDMAMGAGKESWNFMAALKSTNEDRSGLMLPSSSPAPKVPSYAPADMRANDLTMGSLVTMARAGLALGRHGSLSFSGYFSQIDRGAEFADWQPLTHNLDSAGRRNGTGISLRQGSLGADLVLAPTQTLEVRGSAQFFHGGPTSRDRIDTSNDLFYVRRDFGYSGFDSNAEVSWRPNNRLSVLVGGGMSLDYEKLTTLYDVLKSSVGPKPGERAGDEIPTMAPAGHKTLSNLGVNAMVIWSAARWLTVTGGGRMDYHTVYGHKPSGRLAAVFQLLPQLHLKLLYGNAFKAPSPQLLYGNPIAPGDIAGNESLKPSYVHTVESQISYHAGRYLILSSGVAYSYLVDQAAFVQRGINQMALNISRVGSLSWESEARFDYRRRIAAYANLSVNHTVTSMSDPGYVATLSNYSNAAYPVLVANGGVNSDVPFLPLRVGSELSFVSSRQSSTSNALNAGDHYNLPSYVLVGASLRTRGLRLLGKKETSLMLVARNLANTHYADPGFAGIDYPQLGRSFFLKMAQEF